MPDPTPAAQPGAATGTEGRLANDMETAQFRAHRAGMRASVATMASELQNVLGQRLVAYACDVRSPRLVGRWARDDAGLHQNTEARLRALYRTYLILHEADESPSTVRAWFIGSNPDLGDQAPIEVLHAGDREAAVLEAAEAFVE